MQVSILWNDDRHMDIARTFTVFDLAVAAAAGAVLAFAIAWIVYAAQRATAHNAAALNQQLTMSNQELTAAGARLVAGMQSADVHVWEHNLTTGSTWSSASLDHPNDDVSSSFSDRIHPDDRHAFDSLGELQPGETHEQQFRLATAHGEYRWMLSRSHAVLRSGDHVVIGAHLDVTEQRKRTDLVVNLNEELTTRNQALRDFTHVASHDLRSPLRALSTLVEFLREDLPADLPDDVQHHLARIDERVARMNQLIDDLLVYASAHNSKSRVQLVDMSEVIQEALDTIENPHNVVTIVDGDVPPVLLAKTPFAMCVRNLIDNALKHHDKPDGLITIRTRLTEGELQLAVADNGPGIDASHLDAIFEPFRRLRADEQTPGSGIGLSVIKRAAAAHGASIEVESVVGEGSTFTIRWPASPTPSTTSNALLEQLTRS